MQVKNIYKKLWLTLILAATISICGCGKNIQMVYEVKPGENLEAVADKFGTTSERLRELNNLGAVIVVSEGTRLKID